MAACRLASKGRSLADSSYENEVSSIKSLLSMQKPADAPAISINPDNLDPNEFLAPKFIKKLRTKCGHRILEAHANVKDLSLIDAKLKFIEAWQNLPEYGVTLFVIKFIGHKKEELLGIAHNRIMRMDITNGDHLKTWRYNSMKVKIKLKIQSNENFVKKFILFFSGMECKLGDKMYDGTINRGEYYVLMFIS